MCLEKCLHAKHCFCSVGIRLKLQWILWKWIFELKLQNNKHTRLPFMIVKWHFLESVWYVTCPLKRAISFLFCFLLEITTKIVNCPNVTRTVPRYITVISGEDKPMVTKSSKESPDQCPKSCKDGKRRGSTSSNSGDLLRFRSICMHVIKSN